jgi:hypothetical protein
MKLINSISFKKFSSEITQPAETAGKNLYQLSAPKRDEPSILAFKSSKIYR